MDHFRRDCGLVNEHQARCLERRLLGFGRSVRSRNIKPILLGRERAARGCHLVRSLRFLWGET
jgi:hypothetical protein